jgi:hypothetical protein
MKNMPVGSEYFVLSGDKVTTSYTTNLSLIPNNYAWSNVSSDTVFIGLDVLKEAASSRKILFVVSKPDGGSGGICRTSIWSASRSTRDTRFMSSFSSVMDERRTCPGRSFFPR